jgi:hypothetical protein
MERDERLIVYGDVDRAGEQVSREHMHGKTESIWGNSFTHA